MRVRLLTRLNHTVATAALAVRRRFQPLHISEWSPQIYDYLLTLDTEVHIVLVTLIKCG